MPAGTSSRRCAADELRAHTALAYIRRLCAVERELRTQCERDWRELSLADLQIPQ